MADILLIKGTPVDLRDRVKIKPDDEATKNGTPHKDEKCARLMPHNIDIKNDPYLLRIKKEIAAIEKKDPEAVAEQFIRDREAVREAIESWENEKPS